MIVPTGLFSAPADRLRILIADCATWRALRDADSREDALQGIHVPLSIDLPEDAYIDDETGLDRASPIFPRCEITNAGQQATRRKIGHNSWVTNGNLLATFEIQIPDAYSITESTQFNWFGDRIGAIMCEMERLAGSGQSVLGESHLNVVEISIEAYDHEKPEAMQHETIESGESSLYTGPRQELWWAALQVEYF